MQSLRKPIFSRADILTNVLAYVPLGLLLCLWLQRRGAKVAALVLATLLGTVVSLSVEWVQAYLPARVTSLIDFGTNIFGTFLGALLARLVDPESAFGKLLHDLKSGWFKPGALTNMGLIAIVLWALSQTSPFVPSLDLGNLKQGLVPIADWIRGSSGFKFGQAAVYALNIVALCLLARTLGHVRKPVLMLFWLFAGAVLVYKVPVVGRQLSPEALAGWFVALLVVVPFLALAGAGAALVAMLLLVAGFSVAELQTDPVAPHYAFNSVPFLGQMETINGLGDILENIWPFLALGYLARYAAPATGGAGWAIFGGLLVFALAFGLEYYQQFLPGRHGDITVVLLAIMGWTAPWLFGTRRSEEEWHAAVKPFQQRPRRDFQR